MNTTKPVKLSNAQLEMLQAAKDWYMKNSPIGFSGWFTPSRLDFCEVYGSKTTANVLVEHGLLDTKLIYEDVRKFRGKYKDFSLYKYQISEAGLEYLKGINKP